MSSLVKYRSNISLQALLLIVVAASWGFAALTGLRVAHDSAFYAVSTSLLLAIGLFGSTIGIELREARENKGTIFLAITVGVLFKALVIGGVLYLISHDKAFLVLGVAVAQIDPLSVAALLGDNRLSPRVKSILFSWASFDDPITVLLAIYASIAVFGLSGLEVTGRGSGALASLSAYGIDILLNLAFAAATYVVWKKLTKPLLLRRIILVALFGLAVWQFLMLGIAIAGLFVRPRGLADQMARVTRWALLVAGAVLGLLLVNGVDIVGGLGLGLMAFVSQIGAGLALTPHLSRIDRLHLAFAQQNGITAIILALRLEVQYAKAVAIIAPAILVTNVTHFLANAALDRRERAKAANASPDAPTAETEPSARPSAEAEPAGASDRHNPDGPDPNGGDD